MVVDLALIVPPAHITIPATPRESRCDRPKMRYETMLLLTPSKPFRDRNLRISASSFLRVPLFSVRMLMMTTATCYCCCAQVHQLLQRRPRLDLSHRDFEHLLEATFREAVPAFHGSRVCWGGLRCMGCMGEKESGK